MTKSGMLYVALMGVTSLSCGGSKSGNSVTELNVVSYPGDAQLPYRNFLADPFEKTHAGVQVHLIPSESEDVVAQIKAARGASPYDVISLGEPRQITAIREGWIEQTPREQLPNLRDVYPQFVNACRDYGIPETYSLVGLAYNPSVVTAPLAWADLLKPAYKGRIGITTPSSNLGFGFVLMMARLFGGSESDVDPAWEKLKAMEPFVVAPNPTALGQLLERNEVAIAPMWNNDAANLLAKGLKLKFVMPKPGAIVVVSCMDVVKSSVQGSLGREFLNNEISVEFQSHLVQAPFYFGATNSKVSIPAGARDYLPPTAEELSQGVMFDWDKATLHRTEITEQFDREFRR